MLVVNQLLRRIVPLDLFVDRGVGGIHGVVHECLVDRWLVHFDASLVTCWEVHRFLSVVHVCLLFMGSA